MRKENKKRLERIFAVITAILTITLSLCMPLTCGADFIIQDFDYDGVMTGINEYTTTQGTVFFEIKSKYQSNDIREYIELTNHALPVIEEGYISYYEEQRVMDEYGINGYEYFLYNTKYIRYGKTEREGIIVSNEVFNIGEVSNPINLGIIYQNATKRIEGDFYDNPNFECLVSIKDVYIWGESFKSQLTKPSNASVEMEIKMPNSTDIEILANNVVAGDQEVDRRYENENGDLITETILESTDLECSLIKLDTNEEVISSINVEVVYQINQTQVNSNVVLKWYYPKIEDNSLYYIEGVNIPIRVNQNTNENSIDMEVECNYATLENDKELIVLLAEAKKMQMPDSVDLGSWLAKSVSAFMDAEIGMGITIGGILIMFIAFNSVIWLLKLFAGG